MVSFKVLTLVLSLLATQTGRTRAQAACREGWDWMNNTAKLNPCQIVESLDSWCLGVQLTVPELPNGSVYAPPDNTDSKSAKCDCNTPMYTLFSACAACQGAGWVKWSEWSAVCGVAHVGKRPDNYLVTTPIPRWAFMNVTVDDTFAPKAAKLIGGIPEQRIDGPTTTFTPTGSSMQLPMMSTSIITSSSSSDLPSATNTDVPESKTPVGAIAGGTIGGLAVLCVTGFALLFFLKRGGPRVPGIRKASGPMSLFDSQERRPDPRMEEAAAVKRPLLYDPTNPATFSQVHAELERPLRPSSGTQGSTGPYYDPYDPSQPQRSSNDNFRYSGLPQVR